MLRQVRAAKGRLLTLCSKGLFDESQDFNAKKLATTKRILKEEDLRPSKVVEYLDKYVIGQAEAKKTIATSFRNRWRRKGLPEKLKKEIIPKNLLMDGPTGSGKTELARRLADMTDAPFLRVELTSYSQVGYVGKDVNSIITDLVKSAINNYKTKTEQSIKIFENRARDTILSQIMTSMLGAQLKGTDIWNTKLEDLKKGLYDSKEILLLPRLYAGCEFLSLSESTEPHKALQGSIKEVGNNLLEIYKQKIKIYHKVDYEKQAIKLLEEQAIVFLDEVDKLAVPDGTQVFNKGVSTVGVQRDLLPILGGTTVNTKHGDVRTNFILFIAAGAFSDTKVSDLMPEFLGRLPVRVTLKPIREAEFYRILVETKYSLPMQQTELMKREGVNLKFTDQALREIARSAFEINRNTEDLGARRLHSLMERILEDISFQASDLENKDITISKQFVAERLKIFTAKDNLTKYLI